MDKKSRRRKHVPQRMCVACRTTRPKQDLVRVVRTPDGSVVVDETGKRNGRGAYLCRQQRCWDAALERDQLARALKVTLKAETIFDLKQYAQELARDIVANSKVSR